MTKRAASSDASHAAVEACGVVKRFGARTAVDELTLTVRRGEIFGLLGPNGSGKTTTVNLITGLTRLTSGTMRVFGQDMTAHPERVRAALGAVPQETSLYEELTVLHNLRLHAALYFIPKAEQASRIEHVLDLVQLADRRDSRVATFSGGMKRRLALARALLHDPELLVLDEPTLGVDVQSRQALWDYVLALRKRGKTIVITTNHLEEADTLCDRLAILDRGKLIALDTPVALRGRFGATTLKLVTDRALPAAVLAILKAADGVLDVDTADCETTLVVAGATTAAGDALMTIAQSCRVLSLTQREPSLDTVFLGLTGRALRD